MNALGRGLPAVREDREDLRQGRRLQGDEVRQRMEAGSQDPCARPSRLFTTQASPWNWGLKPSAGSLCLSCLSGGLAGAAGGENWDPNLA